MLKQTLSIILFLLMAVCEAKEVIKIIVPYAAGGNTDIVARLYAKELAKQDIEAVVVNRPGAQGLVGTQELMRSAPDGRTLMLSGNGGVVYSSLTSPVAYEAMNKIVPVIQTVIYGQMLVSHSSSKIKTFDQLTKELKTQTVAIGVTNTTSKAVIEELFADQPNAIVVPYSGDSQGIVGLLNKSVEVVVVTWALEPRVETGELVALAVTTPRGRNGVKSLTELGYPISYEGWNGFWAPPGTPKEIVSQLYTKLERIRADRDLQQQIKTSMFGSIAPKRTPEQFSAVIDDDFTKSLVRQSRRKN